MDYTQAIDYLYKQAPMFQNVGGKAYKEGLENTLRLDAHFGHPHTSYKTIHVAGTNGKGSVSHTLAAILQAQGYRVGLYTSPHLLDFTERIRVNGEPVSCQYVADFIDSEHSFFEPLHPSFFEITTALAFCWFREQKVDIAVIETGLGGRLDCTNIITPVLSVITNIGFDHTQFLGDTLKAIASEKAGIIKSGVPVVIGEDQEETRGVFQSKSEQCGSPIVFAQDSPIVTDSRFSTHANVVYSAVGYGQLESQLSGFCQKNNANTILTATNVLKERLGWDISGQSIRTGFLKVMELTGLRGRWQTLQNEPLTICDTGHNSHGIRYVAQQLEYLAESRPGSRLRIVLGMVNDKDIAQVLQLLPQSAEYFFTQASVYRALPAAELKAMAQDYGLKGNHFETVAHAVREALGASAGNDIVFIGGSTYVVADLLALPLFQ